MLTHPKDSLVVTGSDYPTTFSHEIAGVITRVGQNVKDLKVADRVVGFAFDKFATYQRTPETLVAKLKEGDSFQVSSSTVLGVARLTVADDGNLTYEFCTCSARPVQSCLSGSQRCKSSTEDLMARI